MNKSWSMNFLTVFHCIIMCTSWACRCCGLHDCICIVLLWPYLQQSLTLWISSGIEYKHMLVTC